MSGKQVVLITGASRGMGLKAAQFLLEGTHSIPASRVVSLSRSCPAELLEVHKQFPNDLLVVQGDVTQEADNRKAVSAALDKWGRLDAVVLNSGLIKFAPLASMDPQTFADVLNVNLISLQLTLHVAVPALRKSPTGVGKIVVVSSGAAVSGRAAWGAYNVSKAGANALARTLATEEIGSNGHAPIAVFSLRPGQVDTQVRLEDGPSFSFPLPCPSRRRLDADDEPRCMMHGATLRCKRRCATRVGKTLIRPPLMPSRRLTGMASCSRWSSLRM